MPVPLAKGPVKAQECGTCRRVKASDRPARVVVCSAARGRHSHPATSLWELSHGHMSQCLAQLRPWTNWGALPMPTVTPATTSTTTILETETEVVERQLDTPAEPITSTSSHAPDNGNPAAPWQARTALLLGQERLERLAAARVLVVGLGGVGSYAAEFLARCGAGLGVLTGEAHFSCGRDWAGVGSMTIVDGDVVDVSNSNRQLHAMHSTVGLSKVDLMAQRLRDIAPTMNLTAKHAGAPGGPTEEVGSYDWVVDAIDSLEPKKLLIVEAQRAGIQVITACGAGGRLDPSRVRVVPLSATHNDPFAANIRKSLSRRGIKLEQIPAVWSDEPVEPSTLMFTHFTPFKRSYHGTISYLPAQFGLLAAAHVINMLVSGPMCQTYKQTSKERYMQARQKEAKEKRAAIRARTTRAPKNTGEGEGEPPRKIGAQERRRLRRQGEMEGREGVPGGRGTQPSPKPHAEMASDGHEHKGRVPKGRVPKGRGGSLELALADGGGHRGQQGIDEFMGLDI